MYQLENYGKFYLKNCNISKKNPQIAIMISGKPVVLPGLPVLILICLFENRE